MYSNSVCDSCGGRDHPQILRALKNEINIVAQFLKNKLSLGHLDGSAG